MRGVSFVPIVDGMKRSRMTKVAGASLGAVFALTVAAGCNDTMQQDGEQQEQEQEGDQQQQEGDRQYGDQQEDEQQEGGGEQEDG
ncbi:hypothetical protein GCM10009854_04110 [Saccharopolyspora halophila]|uniref:Uncharacterized protein n=2 Tax=Saccharopolyspora halophila TaxID=405551 RepID=A0ABP5SIQ0_9PSEU